MIMFKAFVHVLIFSVIIMISSSCNDTLNPVDTESAQDWQPFNGPPLSAKAMNKPGTLHNEILDSFHTRHSLVTREKINVVDFVRIMTESVNEVLSNNYEETRVTEQDVMLMLRYVTTLSRRGIFNFFGETITEPKKMIEFMSKYDRISELDTNKLKQVLASLPAVTDPMTNPIEDDIFYAAEGTDSWCVFMSVDILRYSKQYWLGINEQRSSLGISDEKHNCPRPVSAQDAGGYISDILGGLAGFFAFGGVGAIVTGPLCSLIFQMGLDGLNGAIDTLDDGDYCWPAGSWDDAC
jgi:hypothetical protein